MTVLVIAEHDNRTLAAATLNAVAAARRLAEPVQVLVAGRDCGGVAETVARVAGVGRVLLADDPRYGDFLPEPLADLVVGLARDRALGWIVAPATATGKGVTPRVAALLDVQPLSEVVAVVAPDTFVRPIYAGNALVTVRSADPVKILTVRGTAFDPAAAEGGDAEIERVAPAADPALSALVSQSLTRSERPELTTAGVVVSGGRGLGDAAHFHLLETLADTLGGAVGASRAAVDAGFAPNDLQVGQTGKIVAPDLYIAVGISGAIQHLAGMKDSKVIVAINKDEEAPIFQVADYGLVADLFKALPELADALS
jgi:electron transfer flavoprotein alpha subunit